MFTLMTNSDDRSATTDIMLCHTARGESPFKRGWSATWLQTTTRNRRDATIAPTAPGRPSTRSLTPDRDIYAMKSQMAIIVEGGVRPARLRCA